MNRRKFFSLLSGAFAWAALPKKVTEAMVIPHDPKVYYTVGIAQTPPTYYGNYIMTEWISFPITSGGSFNLGSYIFHDGKLEPYL